MVASAQPCWCGALFRKMSPQQQKSSLSVKDKTFMKKAAKGGMMEVAKGTLLRKNGQSDDVKSFGKRMSPTTARRMTNSSRLLTKKESLYRPKSPRLNGLGQGLRDMMVKAARKRTWPNFRRKQKTVAIPR